MAPRIEIKTRKEYVSKQLIETIKNISKIYIIEKVI